MSMVKTRMMFNMFSHTAPKALVKVIGQWYMECSGTAAFIKYIKFITYFYF